MLTDSQTEEELELLKLLNCCVLIGLGNFTSGRLDWINIVILWVEKSNENSTNFLDLNLIIYQNNLLFFLVYNLHKFHLIMLLYYQFFPDFFITKKSKLRMNL